MKIKYIKLFLRITIAFGFLSAVADRFGLWSPKVSAWGNWSNFVEYTQIINPWIPHSVINLVAVLATFLEVVFSIGLLLGFKTKFFAQLSGILLLCFGLAMVFSSGLKGALDYSVFSVAAAAFGLSIISDKYLELDIYVEKRLKSI
ncbi:MAG: DoxX family protein [Flavobacterium sp. MedPE-SWcel]|uniref:DoxX family protein n=1 Tax=uncultured Flavobacterium sp. TaxID=165435 RepID=UPI000915369E|nr:DoxX family protein [uncultured Flavobacterium sp.]OIQ15315.1 MAG: DoxX family protein [Flavobacterium sp. MedPE-SWcel]